MLTQYIGKVLGWVKCAWNCPVGKLSLTPIVLKGYLLNWNAFGPCRRLPVGHTPHHSVWPLTPAFFHVSTLPAHL